MRLRVIAAVLMFAGLGLAARADVTNPDFSPSNGFPGYNTTPTTIPGWTSSGAAGSTFYVANGFWNNGTLVAAPGDSTVGFIQGDGSFSTTLGGLTAGQAYTLTFLDNARDYTANGGCCDATPTLTVLVGGSALGSPTALTPVGDSTPFYSVSDSFVATSGSETLEFLSTTPTGTNGLPEDGAVLLSDVHIASAMATPEPSSLMLLGTGLLGAAGMMRRRLFQT